MKGKLVGWLLVILVAAVLCGALLPTFEGTAGEGNYTESAFDADGSEFQVNFVAKPQDIESQDDTQDVDLGNRQNNNLDTIKQDILDATVQIIMVALLERDGEVLSNLPLDQAKTLLQAGRGYAEAGGLGTVVASQDNSFIITHDHWGEFLADADFGENPRCERQPAVGVYQYAVQKPAALPGLRPFGVGRSTWAVAQTGGVGG